MTARPEPTALDRQLMWDRLNAVVEEQAQTLIRTAFSNTVREAGDLSAGVFDLAGRMLAQAVTGTPGHVNAMAASVQHFIDCFPVAEMSPGDVYITNDPWRATGHLHDFTVVTPCFRGERAVGFLASTAHVVDVGGRGFGPDARQVYEEGIFVPIMKLMDAGRIDESLIRLVRANVREPTQLEGDFHSLAACNEVGCRRLIEMMAGFGLDDLGALADYIIDTSHRAMLRQISALPAGTWRYAMRIDGYETPVDLVASLTVGPDGMDIDFDGTSGVSDFGINVPLPYTQAYATFGARCIIGSDVPNNAGSLAAVRVTAPENCILNARPPRAVAARHAIGQMLPDVVLGCLHQAVPDIGPAEGTSCLYNFVLYGGGGIADGHGAHANATPFTITLFHNGGTGARPAKDGLSATAFPSGVRNTPVEINEAISPILVKRKEYRTDSAGAGRSRGGLGQVMEITSLDGAPFAVSSMFDRVRFPPRGRAGGRNGTAGRMTLASGKELRPKGRQTVPAGDTLVIEMPGGGGYGDPSSRPAALIADDVRNGLVSPEAAAAHYGAAMDLNEENLPE